jgi:hypothetical protein
MDRARRLSCARSCPEIKLGLTYELALVRFLLSCTDTEFRVQTSGNSFTLKCGLLSQTRRWYVFKRVTVRVDNVWATARLKNMYTNSNFVF